MNDVAPNAAASAATTNTAADSRLTTPVGSDHTYAELLQRLNEGWRIAGSQRVGYQVRRVLARLLGTQETFNAAVVQFINTLNTASGPVLAALDEVDRHRDALAARERRMEAGMARLLAENEELRTSVAVLRQAAHDLATHQRAIADAAGASAGVTSTASTSAAGGDEWHRVGDGVPAGAVATGAAHPRASTISPSESLGLKYVGFEDRFRGNPDDIKARLTDYADIFAGQANVLDVGCGRGEFLALLKERGVSATGLDVNGAMVAVCREQGLDAVQADAVTYLRQQPPGSLGGLLAAQVVEHLEPTYLADFLEAAFGALKPGAPIVLETINPACWFAFFESYVRDITHVRPLHPDTLSYLMVASGFTGVEVRYRVPYPEHDKLQAIPPSVASSAALSAALSATLGDAVETLNDNVAKINRLLFTYLDYAAVGRKA
jgi:SAM-dependent methyltransferase